MASLVFLPITEGGGIKETGGNFAVRSVSASADTYIPGNIEPPKYSPAPVKALKVVAVPKSMIQAGPP